LGKGDLEAREFDCKVGQLLDQLLETLEGLNLLPEFLD
jgi:hypothetical protein